MLFLKTKTKYCLDEKTIEAFEKFLFPQRINKCALLIHLFHNLLPPCSDCHLTFKATWPRPSRSIIEPPLLFCKPHEYCGVNFYLDLQANQIVKRLNVQRVWLKWSRAGIHLLVYWLSHATISTADEPGHASPPLTPIGPTSLTFRCTRLIALRERMSVYVWLFMMRWRLQHFWVFLCYLFSLQLSPDSLQPSFKLHVFIIYHRLCLSHSVVLCHRIPLCHAAQTLGFFFPWGWM